MVSRFSVLLDNYKQHCISRSALALHLHGRTEEDMQEVGALDTVTVGTVALCFSCSRYDRNLDACPFIICCKNAASRAWVTQHQHAFLWCCPVLSHSIPWSNVVTTV